MGRVYPYYFDPIDWHHHHCAARSRGNFLGDALNLNVHFHTLMLDGFYERYGEPDMRFRVLPPPEDDEVRHVVERLAGRVACLTERRGLGRDADPLTAAQPTLAGLAADSVRVLAPGGGLCIGKMGLVSQG